VLPDQSLAWILKALPSQGKRVQRPRLSMNPFLACIVGIAINVAFAQFNYSFPDCTNGPLKSTTVCDTTREPAVRARALIQMFTDEELTENTDNVSPGVPRLGVPSYQWWSEALVSFAPFLVKKKIHLLSTVSLEVRVFPLPLLVNLAPLPLSLSQLYWARLLTLPWSRP
jgi:hypothetical protein